jgi:hypothetical protein
MSSTWLAAWAATPSSSAAGASRSPASDEEDPRTFEGISRALRPGGHNLVQPPRALRQGAPRDWIPTSDMIELDEHRWDSVDELRQIYASVGLEMLTVYYGNGRPSEPKPGQFEIFVEARKGD